MIEVIDWAKIFHSQLAKDQDILLYINCQIEYQLQSLTDWFYREKMLLAEWNRRITT